MCSITPCQNLNRLHPKAKFGLECIKGGCNLNFKFVRIHATNPSLGALSSSLGPII